MNNILYGRLRVEKKLYEVNSSEFYISLEVVSEISLLKSLEPSLSFDFFSNYLLAYACPCFLVSCLKAPL